MDTYVGHTDYCIGYSGHLVTITYGGNYTRVRLEVHVYLRMYLAELMGGTYVYTKSNREYYRIGEGHYMNNCLLPMPFHIQYNSIVYHVSA